MAEARHFVVSTTTGSEDTATALARGILAAGLGACVQVVRVRSLYRWNGEVQETDEWRLDVKTGVARVTPLVEHIRSVHAYDVPEIIATPIVGGGADYLAWVDAELTAG